MGVESTRAVMVEELKAAAGGECELWCHGTSGAVEKLRAAVVLHEGRAAVVSTETAGSSMLLSRIEARTRAGEVFLECHGSGGSGVSLVLGGTVYLFAERRAMIEPTSPAVFSRDEILVAGDLAEEDGRDDLAGALRLLAGHPGPDMSIPAEILVLAAFGGLRLRVVSGAYTGGMATVDAATIVEAPGLERVEWDAGAPSEVALTFREIVASDVFMASGFLLMDREGRAICGGWFNDLDPHVVLTGSTLKIVVNISFTNNSIRSMTIRG